MDGVSVVICCHNGAARLPATLAHLKAQRAGDTLWELILVNNASTDDTGETARRCWQDIPIPFRIVNEARLGVRFARERGLAEARYAFVGFVDDDNWVSPEWVATANEILSCDSSLGAVGSIREPECEVPAPDWFEHFHSAYAIFTDSEFKRLKRSPTFLPTAGLCVRKAAWERLVRDGFCTQVPSRVAKNLQGGEDTELTIALRLGGWRLETSSRLRIKHFMPRARLNWAYLRRLLRANGNSDVWLDAYSEHSLWMEAGPRRWLSESWWFQLARTQVKLACRPWSLLAALTSMGEGRYDVIEFERLLGRTLGLLSLRHRYRALRRSVREAPWRRSNLHHEMPKVTPNCFIPTA
jgi:glycosyltransferase involved in cell wall biosynthesis